MLTEHRYLNICENEYLHICEHKYLFPGILGSAFSPNSTITWGEKKYFVRAKIFCQQSVCQQGKARSMKTIKVHNYIKGKVQKHTYHCNALNSNLLVWLKTTLFPNVFYTFWTFWILFGLFGRTLWTKGKRNHFKGGGSY